MNTLLLFLHSLFAKTDTNARGRRRKQLLDDLKEMRGYGKLKEETLDRTVWRTRVGTSYGRFVRQTAELIYIYAYKVVQI
jgi:hypothetical protein